MYPCLVVFASIQVLNVIQSKAKDLVDMIAPCGCTIQNYRDYTAFYRQSLNDMFVIMLSNNV